METDIDENLYNFPKGMYITFPQYTSNEQQSRVLIPASLAPASMVLITTLYFFLVLSSYADKGALVGECGKRGSKAMWSHPGRSNVVSCVCLAPLWGGASLGAASPSLWHVSHGCWPDTALTKSLAKWSSQWFQWMSPAPLAWLAFFPHMLICNWHRHNWKMTLC